MKSVPMVEDLFEQAAGGSGDSDSLVSDGSPVHRVGSMGSGAVPAGGGGGMGMGMGSDGKTRAPSQAAVPVPATIPAATAAIGGATGGAIGGGVEDSSGSDDDDAPFQIPLFDDGDMGSDHGDSDSDSDGDAGGAGGSADSTEDMLAALLGGGNSSAVNTGTATTTSTTRGGGGWASGGGGGGGSARGSMNTGFQGGDWDTGDAVDTVQGVAATGMHMQPTGSSRTTPVVASTAASRSVPAPLPVSKPLPVVSAPVYTAHHDAGAGDDDHEYSDDFDDLEELTL